MSSLIHKVFAFISFALRLKRPFAMPVHYHIEITNRCNLQCRFCPYREVEMSSESFGNMSIVFFERLLRQIRKSPPPEGVSLHLGGEPLLHPQINIFVRKVHTILGISPMMASNGTLLTADIAEKLSEAGGAKLIIDFTANKKEFESVRDGAVWENVRNNIVNALATTENIIISVRSLDGDIDGLQTILGRYENLFVSNFKLHNVGGDFAQKIEEEFNLKIERKKYYVCTHPWFGMAISWDGKVVVCCRDVLHQHIIGDLKDSSIKEIWRGEKFGEVREKLSRGHLKDLPLCKTCSRPWDKENSIRELTKKYLLHISS